MKTVYKYPFDIDDVVQIEMPEGAQVLKVDQQNAQPMIWALVDTDQPTVVHRFLVRGTGHPIDVPDGQVVEHVGSFFSHHGLFVWHLFRHGYRTKTGKLLTDVELDKLADEAEQGYDIEQLIRRVTRS